jgi:hypothetical protein
MKSAPKVSTMSLKWVGAGYGDVVLDQALDGHKTMEQNQVRGKDGRHLNCNRKKCNQSQYCEKGLVLGWDSDSPRRTLQRQLLNANCMLYSQVSYEMRPE